VKLFDATIDKLQTALDLRLERQNLLSSNVANADTPGYVSQDFDFSKAMQQAEASAAGPTEAQAGELAHPPAFEPQAMPSRAGFDGNRVDSDQAMVSLAENALQYGANAQAVSKKLAILLYTASDGNS
jgi:flagellar basal-body rod protein FlgB